MLSADARPSDDVIAFEGQTWTAGLAAIGKAHNVGISQVCLRWVLQRGAGERLYSYTLNVWKFWLSFSLLFSSRKGEGGGGGMIAAN